MDGRTRTAKGLVRSCQTILAAPGLGGSFAENNVPLPVVRSMVGHVTDAVTDHLSTSVRTQPVLPSKSWRGFILALWIVLWM